MAYSLETLEFARLLELVSRNAQTPMGVDRFALLRPFTDRRSLETSLSAISETIKLNEEKQVTWSFSGLGDPSDAVAILKINNATLEPTLILEISRVCNQALFARSAIQPEKEFVPTLWQIVEHIPPTLLAVIDRINKKLLPGGEIDDKASPELARIRHEINLQRGRLTKSLESAMRAAGNAIQDEIVTMRNDRFVIPVKADFRGKVSGVAHGFSSSGSTVFVEPLDAIEANNELQNLKGKEEREIARILFALTEELREQLPAVELAVEAVAELDFIKAKVEFARKFRAVVPEITGDKTLDLTDARHPLLSAPPALAGGQNINELPSTRSPVYAGDSDWIVPNSFTLTDGRPVMIISGANAGGKTVVLKTAGLLSLMAISGLPVPASEARIPFYRSVLADIGDHQSLAANLSTFSSHMSNIASMIGECEPPSLVLLDEAGTGTDPEEGSALGVAIVDHFRQKGAQVIASTHYRGLKMYAANDPSVINASVEFDEKTLRPTYKLLLGLAGASSGIEIARRFGITQPVIDDARRHLDISAQEAEIYLKKLQTETKIATDLRIALEEEREATAMKYAALEVEAVKKEKARQKEFEGELAKAVDEFDRQSKAFIQTIEDKALKTRLDKERQSRKAELNRAVMAKVGSSSRGGSLHKGPGSNLHNPTSIPADTPLTVGSRVFTSFGNVGVIEKLDRDVAEVLVGGMRLREKVANLQLAETESPPSGNVPSKDRGSLITRDVDGGDAPAELNLIGKTTAEAEYEIDRFLDEAYMSSLPRVRIIHGFGTGALKNYVHHFLKNSDMVDRFEFAPSSQGGHGATIAELKQ
ncbi:MAG TPA: Smr/MutS family protein [Pyrinomonadaceae bacterium]|nr:Smr/MutS family protein [Chloracidobacterium sp.]MBP9934518.1 Smr/MutS family protein [Pyrinomonadaceae bacterium]MBK7802480.1 Smr/MutS family protein [Chloracidobacterium sp.]MBK9437350.1 Smr/MutS family protein [Chloracidobacterium sp.]MBL0240024.1 Smr/MutS family protein [Chloracidobacterium sp.]